MANSNEYMRVYMAQRYRKRMAAAVNHLGGKCIDCGSDEDLEFDHLDRDSKIANVSTLVTYSDEKFWGEVAKCELRCRLCHEKRTIVQLGKTDARKTHGTLSSYRYCRCDLCRKAMSDYNKEHQRLRSSTG